MVELSSSEVHRGLGRQQRAEGPGWLQGEAVGVELGGFAKEEAGAAEGHGNQLCARERA